VGFAGEDEKHSLKGVVGCVRVTCHPAADAQHHPAMAIHQGGERRFGRGVAPGAGERGQQLGVGQGADCAGREQDGQVIAGGFRVR
jgi:hypothetical protein